MNAVIFGDEEVVRSVLRRGANARDVESNAEGWPVLHLGLWSRSITRLLLESGADANATDKTGCSALARVFSCVSSDNWRRATSAILLEFGANEDGRTPDGESIRKLRKDLEARL